MKKKFHGKDFPQKRKKQKTSNAEEENSHSIRAEELNISTLREGMLLLGCATEIRPNSVLMSLPGCLVGNVPFTNVSRKFMDELSSQDDEDIVNSSLESVVTVGAVYPCKVMQIVIKENLKKPVITLSIDPKDVNEELRVQSLYLKMVVYVAVESVEDHGYVMDMGIKGAQGFLPFSLYCDSNAFTVGQVIATMVKKLPTAKNGNVVWLSSVSFNDTYPEIDIETMKLSSILPGANVIACVTRAKHPFYYMKCMNFDACANVSCLGSSKKTLTEGMQVSCTVLYIHPISHMIYLSLVPKPTPQTFKEYFHTKKFDLLKNVQYDFTWHHQLLFKTNKGQLGFIKRFQLPEKGEFSQESLLKTPIVPKARVIFLHYMDNLVQLTFKESMINMEFKTTDELKVGDTFEATVKKHMDRGMFVRMCPGVNGFVRHVYMSDVFVTMPEKLHPVESQVKCRVLSTNHPSGLDLTCKPSLLSIPEDELLKSYEEAHEGDTYKGVIVQKRDTHLLVLFFNDVKGVVPMEEVPGSSLLYIGQTVSCEVLQCNAEKKKLKLSMMGRSKVPAKKANKSSKAPTSAVDLSSVRDAFDPVKTHKALIANITAHQVNIVVGGTYKGRVHITQLGSQAENCLPLRDFSPGKPIRVHVLGQCHKRSHTFLPITHRMTKHFLECSLEYPPPVSMEKKLRPGMEVTGFVKEIYSTFAILWLSPMCTGTLEYLHFSENPKVLRKLKKQLKIGMSINVTVFKFLEKEYKQFGKSSLLLTKLGNKLIEAGTNVIGLVKAASPEEGLVLDLPHSYKGTVSLTDLQDNYAPIDPLLSKCHKLQFVLCHVIEVEHSSKNCVLSLRKSRLYKHTAVDPVSITPEVSIHDVKDGGHFKGYVKSSGNFLIVNFGRMVDGKVRAHTCTTLDCILCKCTQDAFKKYPVGSMVEVIVDGVCDKKKNLYNLLLPELADLESTRPSRLKVTEDINWDDV